MSFVKNFLQKLNMEPTMYTMYVYINMSVSKCVTKFQGVVHLSADNAPIKNLTHHVAASHMRSTVYRATAA